MTSSTPFASTGKLQVLPSNVRKISLIEHFFQLSSIFRPHYY